MIKRDGILFHRSRIMDEQRWVKSAGLTDIKGLLAQGLNVFTPVVDRWPFLACNWLVDRHQYLSPLCLRDHLKEVLG